MFERPQVEVIRFDVQDIICTSGGGSSTQSYATAGDALTAECGGYNGGATNNFSCNDFGGYNASNPPSQNAQVTLGGGTYVFDYKGNHWKLAN